MKKNAHAEIAERFPSAPDHLTDGLPSFRAARLAPGLNPRFVGWLMDFRQWSETED
jgi:hypothetical protein